MKPNFIKSMRVLLPIFLVILFTGCDRSSEEAQQVATPEETSEVTEVEVSETEVASEVEAIEVTEEATEEPQPSAEAPDAELEIAIEDIPALAPLPWLTEPLPEAGTPELVRFVTDAGDLVIAVYPQAAPNAAERFLHLVEIGYYNDTPVSRVVPGFVAQFGINWRDGFKQWKDENFDDDPSLFAFEPGTLAFAKAGPNTNSTQVFINYGNNNRLASPEYNFSVFGKVVQGMDVVEDFKSVGDPSGGLNQSALWDNGAVYLATQRDKPNMILETSRIQ